VKDQMFSFTCNHSRRIDKLLKTQLTSFTKRCAETNGWRRESKRLEAGSYKFTFTTNFRQEGYG